MNKIRLENFTDAVFAIVITLLILDIRVPHVDYADLLPALVEILPNIASYVISFAIVGVYWVGHHFYFNFVAKTNNVFTWLNVLMLLIIVFLPFPTSLMGEYPFKTIPVLIYGFTLLAINIIGLIMVHYLHHHRELAAENFTIEIKKRFVRVFGIINITYLVAMAMATILPHVSYIIFIAAIAYLIYANLKRPEIR